MSCRHNHQVCLYCDIAYRGVPVDCRDLAQRTTCQWESKDGRFTSHPFLATRHGVHCNFPPRPDRLLPLEDFLLRARRLADSTSSVELLTSPRDSDRTEVCVAGRDGTVSPEDFGVLGCVAPEICLGGVSDDGGVLQNGTPSERPKIVTSNPSIISSIESNKG
jgi:hypothetical protein